jgi:hypothetical protein
MKCVNVLVRKRKQLGCLAKNTNDTGQITAPIYSINSSFLRLEPIALLRIEASAVSVTQAIDSLIFHQGQTYV